MSLINLMILGLLHIDVEVVEDHFPIISDGFIAALSCIFSVPQSLLDTPQLPQLLPYHFCSFFSLKTLKVSKSRQKSDVLDSSIKQTKLTILSTEDAQDSEFHSILEESRRL